MSLYEHLAAAHSLLTREIGRERRKSSPDAARLTRLKKERLAVKDRLHRHIPNSANAQRFVRQVLARLRRAHA